MRNSYIKTKFGNILRLRPVQGFTIVELVVVISIIGILSTIVVFSYGSWRQSTVVAQLKSDLNGLAASMEDARNFGNSYPATYPNSTFRPSEGVTITGGSPDGVSYCFNAVSLQSPGLYYYMDSAGVSKVAQLGKCATFSVIFDPNNGSPVSQILDVLKNSKLTKPSDPVKEDDRFDGWYQDNASFLNIWDFGGNRLTSNITLYAKYSPDSGCFDTVAVGLSLWCNNNVNINGRFAAANSYTQALDEKWCYGNNWANCGTYRGLYNWGTTMQVAPTLPEAPVATEGSRGICPLGFHVPSVADWTLLRDSPGGIASLSLPLGGYFGASSNLFAGMGTGYYWTSSSGNGAYRTAVRLYSNNTIDFFDESWGRGMSVHCLRD